MRLSQNQINKVEAVNDFYVMTKISRPRKKPRHSSRSWKNVKKQAQWGHVISHAHIDPQLNYKQAMSAEDYEAYLGYYFPDSPDFPDDGDYRFDELDLVWLNPNDNRLFNEGNTYYSSPLLDKWRRNNP